MTEHEKSILDFCETKNQEVENLADKIKERTDCQDNTTELIGLYAIKDIKLGKFMPPFFAYTIDEAKRIVKAQVDFSQTLLSQFPQDYELYFIGKYSLLCGAIFQTSIEYILNLSELQSDETKKYITILNTINDKLNTFENSVTLANEMLQDFDKKEDIIKRRMSKVEAILDKNVDLFPIPTIENVGNKINGALQKLKFQSDLKKEMKRDKVLS